METIDCVFTIMKVLFMVINCIMWNRIGKQDARVDMFVKLMKYHGYGWEVDNNGKVYIGARVDHSFYPTEKERKLIVKKMKDWQG